MGERSIHFETLGVRKYKMMNISSNLVSPCDLRIFPLTILLLNIVACSWKVIGKGGLTTQKSFSFYHKKKN